MSSHRRGNLKADQRALGLHPTSKSPTKAIPPAITFRAATRHTQSQAAFSDALACVRNRLWKCFSLAMSGTGGQKPSFDLLNHFVELLRHAK
jgi:hypothetical protein